uniref:Uncharacterized protein n=1 Tax=Ralstonia solanacearum TaxID=305 RepID=A0A0S4U438_RALSL|nr:protein of unknown function [Ralstonia solanacearum]
MGAVSFKHYACAPTRLRLIGFLRYGVCVVTATVFEVQSLPV